jgi:homogentisate 1,2-dioxygenase
MIIFYVIGANGLANPRDFQTPTGIKIFNKHFLDLIFCFQRGLRIDNVILQ